MAKVSQRDISKAYDAVANINKVMLANIDKYKAAKAAGKDTKKYMDIARQLTAKRKKAEAEMERVIAMLDREAELVVEANADGTISPDEDRKREKLVKDSVKNLKKLVDDIKRQAYKIGGTFRSPGIRHEIHKHLKNVVNDLIRG